MESRRDLVPGCVSKPHSLLNIGLALRGLQLTPPQPAGHREERRPPGKYISRFVRTCKSDF